MYFLSIFTVDFVKQFQISIYYLNSIQIHTFFNRSQLRFKSRAWKFTLPLCRLSPSTIPLFNSAFIIARDRSCSCHFFCYDINSNKNISIWPSSKLHMLQRLRSAAPTVPSKELTWPRTRSTRIAHALLNFMSAYMYLLRNALTHSFGFLSPILCLFAQQSNHSYIYLSRIYSYVINKN